jgi:hypothetical protein
VTKVYSIPEQFLPSPVCPPWHWQLYEPGLLVQFALTSQTLVDSLEHSSISGNKKIRMSYITNRLRVIQWLSYIQYLSNFFHHLCAQWGTDSCMNLDCWCSLHWRRSHWSIHWNIHQYLEIKNKNKLVIIQTCWEWFSDSTIFMQYLSNFFHHLRNRWGTDSCMNLDRWYSFR